MSAVAEGVEVAAGIDGGDAPPAQIGTTSSRRLYTAVVMAALHHLGGKATINRLERFTGLAEYNLYRICGALARHGLLVSHAEERPLAYSIPDYEDCRKRIAAITVTSGGGDSLSALVVP